MSAASSAPAPALPADVDTLVLGGGIAGLAYAHALGPDADVLVLEAAARAGGLIHTQHERLADGPLHFECGPEALQDDAAETQALFAELALTPLPAAANARRRFLLRDGTMLPLPMSPAAFLASPLLGVGGKLRALTEPLRDARTALDGSVADFVRHRLGAQVLQRLVDPFVTGIYAGDPEQLSLRAVFPLLHDMVSEHGSLLGGLRARRRTAQQAAAAGVTGADAGTTTAGASPPASRHAPSLLSLPGGLGTLPEALGVALGAGLRLGVRVAALRPVNDAGVPSRWCVDIGAGEGTARSVRARRVVVALPVGAAARLLASCAPALGAALASMISESVVSVAHAWRRADVSHALDGFGYLVPSGEQRLHLGTLFSSSIQPARAPDGLVLLRTLLGGARHARMLEWPDEELLAVVHDDVAPLLGLRGAPRFTHIARWRAALPRYDLAQPQRQERIDALLAGLPGLAILGNHRRGISVNALIAASRALAREHRAQLVQPAHAAPQAPRSA